VTQDDDEVSGLRRISEILAEHESTDYRLPLLPPEAWEHQRDEAEYEEYENWVRFRGYQAWAGRVSRKWHPHDYEDVVPNEKYL
jgi:hypothetical protein